MTWLLLALGAVNVSQDGGASAYVNRVNCVGPNIVCTPRSGYVDISSPGGGSVPAACGAGQAVTSNGTALVCTADITAKDLACTSACVSDAEIAAVSGAKVSGAVASATLAAAAEGLAADPANCPANQYAVGIAASGAAQCAAITGGQVTGAVATATALAADPAACPGGQFVTDMTAAGVLACATPAGGSGVTAQVTGANYTNNTVTPTTVVSWSVTASTQYGFMCALTATGTTTSLPRFNLTGPASTNVSFLTQRFTTTSAQTLLVLQALSASAQTAACTSACNATQLPTLIHGSFIVGGSGGTVSLQAASSTAGQTVTVFRGSFCRVF